MEEYLNRLQGRLRDEMDLIDRAVEPEYRELSFQTYTSIALCFKKKIPYPEAFECADAVPSINKLFEAKAERLKVAHFDRVKSCLNTCEMYQNQELKEDSRKCGDICMSKGAVELEETVTRLKTIARDLH